MSISRTFDGKYRIDGWLDTEAGAEVAAALETFTRKRDPNLSVFEDPIGRRRAEALHQLARHATNHAAGCHSATGSSRHSLIIAITLEALQSVQGQPDGITPDCMYHRKDDPAPVHHIACTTRGVRRRHYLELVAARESWFTG